MKRRYKILRIFLVVVALAVSGLAVVLSYTSPCPSEASESGSERTYSAAVSRCYGSPDVIEIANVPKAEPGDDEVLVRVKAASVNPLDYHYMRGSPYIMRLEAGIGSPADERMGVDFAGVVEAVGSGVSKFKVGDEVFGGRSGAFGEYVTVRESRAIAHMPANVSFPEAAAVGIAGVTALQAVRDVGKVTPGDRVLINGASGGVGTFAVQIAKFLGAEVTGICSTRNVDMVRTIGADHVIDYTQDNYTERDERYDVIVDNVGNHPVTANTGVLEDDGRFVLVGGEKGDWIAPLKGPIKTILLAPFVDQKMSSMLAQLRQEDLEFLARLMESGDLDPVIDQEFPLDAVAEAIRYSETGRARGKIIVTID
ncbi:MAG: NAD(P)-dependent alcohol dehydrogenase [Gammaproteobacteria bacterium]|nr:NAD(P)-dependent alcohol dehydrogenase [Woeseia sp.]MBT8103079.1 NAD(P)-dependent alcohol dehydrogenase [Gammaproteobacteria bacterium]